jgi:hypothetical protein
MPLDVIGPPGIPLATPAHISPFCYQRGRHCGISEVEISEHDPMRLAPEHPIIRNSSPLTTAHEPFTTYHSCGALLFARLMLEARFAAQRDAAGPALADDATRPFRRRQRPPRHQPATAQGYPGWLRSALGGQRQVRLPKQFRARPPRRPTIERVYVYQRLSFPLLDRRPKSPALQTCPRLQGARIAAGVPARAAGLHSP